MDDESARRDLRDHHLALSGLQIALRVLLSCAVTALVAAGTFMIIRYLGNR